MFAGLMPQVWTYSTGRLRMLRDDLIRDKDASEIEIEQATYGKAIGQIDKVIRERGYDPLDHSPEAYGQD